MLLFHKWVDGGELADGVGKAVANVVNDHAASETSLPVWLRGVYIATDIAMAALEVALPGVHLAGLATALSIAMHDAILKTAAPQNPTSPAASQAIPDATSGSSS